MLTFWHAGDVPQLILVNVNGDTNGEYLHPICLGEINFSRYTVLVTGEKGIFVNYVVVLIS